MNEALADGPITRGVKLSELCVESFTLNEARSCEQA